MSEPILTRFDNPVPVEVINAQGAWIDGFELLRFDAAGTVLIRSVRTGTSRHLPMGQWRDPAELEVLAAEAGEVG